MKRWIRDFLGIEEICLHLKYLDTNMLAQQAEIKRLYTKLTPLASGLARIIAKVDPMYGKAEDDPERVKESKIIEEQIIRKLVAEHLASNRTEQQP